MSMFSTSILSIKMFILMVANSIHMQILLVTTHVKFCLYQQGLPYQIVVKEDCVGSSWCQYYQNKFISSGDGFHIY